MLRSWIRTKSKKELVLMNAEYEAPVLTELGVLTVDTLAGTGDGGVHAEDGCPPGWELNGKYCFEIEPT